MWVRKVQMLPAECIVRGYLEGSALKEYRQTGMISGYRLHPDFVRLTACRNLFLHHPPKQNPDMTRTLISSSFVT